MKSIYIEEKELIPKVILDKEKGIFEIAGRACPENYMAFYAPIFKWLDDYSDNPNEHTVFVVKLFYYNTASSKALMKILQILAKIKKKGFGLTIKWYYNSADEDLMIAGEDYSALINIPFEFIKN